MGKSVCLFAPTRGTGIETCRLPLARTENRPSISSGKKSMSTACIAAQFALSTFFCFRVVHESGLHSGGYGTCGSGLESRLTPFLENSVKYCTLATCTYLTQARSHLAFRPLKVEQSPRVQSFRSNVEPSKQLVRLCCTPDSPFRSWFR